MALRLLGLGKVGLIGIIRLRLGLGRSVWLGSGLLLLLLLLTPIVPLLSLLGLLSLLTILLLIPLLRRRLISGITPSRLGIVLLLLRLHPIALCLLSRNHRIYRRLGLGRAVRLTRTGSMALLGLETGVSELRARAVPVVRIGVGTSTWRLGGTSGRLRSGGIGATCCRSLGLITAFST